MRPNRGVRLNSVTSVRCCEIRQKGLAFSGTHQVPFHKFGGSHLFYDNLVKRPNHAKFQRSVCFDAGLYGIVGRIDRNADVANVRRRRR
jgi:hypothetical protein